MASHINTTEEGDISLHLKLTRNNYWLLGLLNKSKSINHRGAQALRNSPWAILAKGPDLQRWHFTSRPQSSDSYRTELHGFYFVPFVPFVPS